MQSKTSLALWVYVLCSTSGALAEQPGEIQPTRYSGMCDASAAVALDSLTLIVADDERNTLQVYRADRPGPPMRSFPWDTALGIRPGDDHPEADVEGAAALQGRVYWITSHGRNKKGKWRANRHRFFATAVTRTPDGLEARPFGKPCTTLIGDLVKDRRMRPLRLDAAYGWGVEKSEPLAPKQSGMNVEGLAATPDGRSLLIGFRNPLPGGRALIVPLENPADVLTAQAAPQFGAPILLLLEYPTSGRAVALGIRSIAYSRHHEAYLIAAGPSDTRKAFALFRWSGAAGEAPQLLARPTAALMGVRDFAPEALVVFPGRSAIQLLSDDGSLAVRVASPAECLPDTYDNGYCEAKYLLDHRRKTFKSVFIAVPK